MKFTGSARLKRQLTLGQPQGTDRSGSLLLTEDFPPPLPGQLSCQVAAAYKQHKSSCHRFVSGTNTTAVTHTLEPLPEQRDGKRNCYCHPKNNLLLSSITAPGKT